MDPKTSKVLFTPDTGSEQEKIDELLKQFVDEKEIDFSNDTREQLISHILSLMQRVNDSESKKCTQCKSQDDLLGDDENQNSKTPASDATSSLENGEVFYIHINNDELSQLMQQSFTLSEELTPMTDTAQVSALFLSSVLGADAFEADVGEPHTIDNIYQCPSETWVSVSTFKICLTCERPTMNWNSRHHNMRANHW